MLDMHGRTQRVRQRQQLAEGRFGVARQVGGEEEPRHLRDRRRVRVEHEHGRRRTREELLRKAAQKESVERRVRVGVYRDQLRVDRTHRLGQCIHPLAKRRARPRMRDHRLAAGEVVLAEQRLQARGGVRDALDLGQCREGLGAGIERVHRDDLGTETCGQRAQGGGGVRMLRVRIVEQIDEPREARRTSGLGHPRNVTNGPPSRSDHAAYLPRMSTLPRIRATTILAVRKNGRLALGGDGQVSVGDTVMKAQAVKVRALKGGRVLAGFAGSAADALTLFEKFEEKLERFPGNLPRAAVELAKDWRSDRVLRRLEALLIVADTQHGFMVSGTGEIIEPDDGILAIGSGGSYALAAARALVAETDLPPREIVERALRIAGDICVYTNTNITVLEPVG